MTDFAAAYAATIAKALAADHNWLVWKFNGDFNYIDWQDTESKLQSVLLKEFEKTVKEIQ